MNQLSGDELECHGGHTPVMAHLVRPEHAQRHRAPAAHSTRPLSLPPSRSALPKLRAELAVRHRSSTIAARR